MQKFDTDNSGIKKVTKIIISEIEKDLNKYKIKNRDNTSAIFLAGAPGCGKTEFILSTLHLKKDFFFIDVDSYREYFGDYKGKNSKGFQKAVSYVLDGILKYCFKYDINFILDGTFKSKKHVVRNLENCIRKHRKVEIFFIFQNPYISYYYTFLREIENTRNIPLEGFIECFYNSIENIFYAENKFKNIKLFILEKKVSDNGKKDYKYSKIENLTYFCNQYNVDYQNGEFLRKDFLFNGVSKFRNILKIISPLIKSILFFKKKLGQKK